MTNHELAVSKLVNGIYPELFSDYIGQVAARKKIEFYLRSYLHTRQIPNLLITSQKGNGKTHLARETSKGLLLFNSNGEVILNEQKQLPRRKKFLEINCTDIKTMNGFLNDYAIPSIQDSDITVFFDEASEIPPDVSMGLLTIMAPNVAKTQYTFQNTTVNFDFTRQSFIFATAEPQLVFHHLRDRLKRIDLEEYTQEELALIIQKGAKKVEFEPKVLAEISCVTRGNARNAEDYASEVKTYLGKDSGSFTMKNWNDLRQILSIAPLGLNASEVKILRILNDSPNGVSLTALAAKMGMSREALQRDYELYLLKHSLISIETGKGRMITPKGQNCLVALDAA